MALNCWYEIQDSVGSPTKCVPEFPGIRGCVQKKNEEHVLFVLAPRDRLGHMFKCQKWGFQDISDRFYFWNYQKSFIQQKVRSFGRSAEENFWDRKFPEKIENFSYTKMYEKWKFSIFFDLENFHFHTIFNENFRSKKNRK